MLWSAAVVLIFLWMVGMVTGFTMGSFIHLFYVVAVVLLVVSIHLEVMLNRKLKRGLRQ